MTVFSPDAERFASLLLARDWVGAQRYALELVDQGVPVGEVLTRLIAPAQVLIGDRWHTDTASVADEHAATAIADAVVSVLTAAQPAMATGPHVVVLCAEGEWHLLAARLVAETLRADGYDVAFLGASMPVTHLARFLTDTRPDVVALSCSTPLALDGVLAFTTVAHDVGVPVLAGGRALGPDETRAHALGVDMWAPDALAAAARLRGPLPSTLRAPTADVAGAAAVRDAEAAVVDTAMVELAARFPALASYRADQLARTREDFAYSVRFAAATVLTGDPRVFAEYLPWLEALLAARGLPASVLAVSLESLRAAAAAVGVPRLLDVLEQSP